MKILLGKDAEKLLRGLPVAKSEYIKNSAHMVKVSKKIGFPLVLKVISKKAVHKTDMKAVRIVQSMSELRKSYMELGRIAQKLKGQVLAQEFVKGQELIVGIKKDPVFGHAIMFGIGGTLVEVIKDVTFRVCPISNNDAQDMIDELKYKEILYGVRGGKAVNVKAVKSVLIGLSKLPVKKKKLAELDVNPLIANDKTARIVDVRISI